jgi:hypothetical protein
MNQLEAGAAQQKARQALARRGAAPDRAAPADADAAALLDPAKRHRLIYGRAADDVLVDPRSLVPWRGRGRANADPQKADGPLGMAFFMSLPLGSQIALASGRDGEIPPAAQWLNSLIHLVSHLDERKSVHFVLSSPDDSHGVAVHVLDTVARVCPPGLPAMSAKQIAGVHGSAPLRPGDLVAIHGLKNSAQYNGLHATVGSKPQNGRVSVTMTFEGQKKQLSIDVAKNLEVPAPLLAVRYQANGKGDPQFAKKMKVSSSSVFGLVIIARPHPNPPSYYVQHQVFETVMIQGGHPFIKINAESVAEVQAAVQYLEANRARLSADFLAHFARQPHQAENGVSFRASFLAPPFLSDPVARTKALIEKCANCDVSRAERAPKFQVCSRCHGAAYCSRDCQSTHWKKAHKRVCGKSQSELSGDSGSVLVSLVPTEQMVGKHAMFLSQQGGLSQKLKAVPGHAPDNIHGENEFIIKVQVPIAGAQPGCQAMVYDQQRSFQTFVDLRASEDARRVEALVRDYAETNGMKAYLRARREGSNLRIHTDQRAPMQSW